MVALVFYQQEKDTTRRGQKQICQHSFHVHANGETGVEGSQIPASALDIIPESRVSMPTGAYLASTGELAGRWEPRGSEAGDGRRPARGPDIGGLDAMRVGQRRREGAFHLGGFVLVGSKVHVVRRRKLRTKAGDEMKATSFHETRAYRPSVALSALWLGAAVRRLRHQPAPPSFGCVFTSGLALPRLGIIISSLSLAFVPDSLAVLYMETVGSFIGWSPPLRPAAPTRNPCAPRNPTDRPTRRRGGG